MTAALHQRSVQPWIIGPWFDGLLILGPPLVSVMVALVWGQSMVQTEMSAVSWFILVVCVDVAHVYSTLFRTYFDKGAWASRGHLFAMVPLLAWIGGVLLYSMGAAVFWRTLAYLAVFHFVRQQYGFARIYSRDSISMRPFDTWARRLDAVTIYVATGYPLLHWHVTMPKNFHWFVAGDFVPLAWPWLDRVGLSVYAVVMGTYLITQATLFVRKRAFNVPKNLVVIGTATSWYVGIVLFDGDWTFTLANVVSHGVPYMALVWATKRKELVRRSTPEDRMARLFRRRGIPLFILALLTLAYLEELFWDGLVWRDHAEVFPLAGTFPHIQSSALLLWIVPLLAVPQVTHYVVDGFIWRVNAIRSSLGGESTDHEVVPMPKSDSSAAVARSVRSAPS